IQGVVATFGYPARRSRSARARIILRPELSSAYSAVGTARAMRPALFRANLGRTCDRNLPLIRGGGPSATDGTWRRSTVYECLRRRRGLHRKLACCTPGSGESREFAGPPTSACRGSAPKWAACLRYQELHG